MSEPDFDFGAIAPVPPITTKPEPTFDFATVAPTEPTFDFAPQHGATGSFAPMAGMGQAAYQMGMPPPDETFWDSTIRKATNLPKNVGSAFEMVGTLPMQELGHQVAGVGKFLDSTWTGQKLVDFGTQLEASSRAEREQHQADIGATIFDPTDEILATITTSVATSVPALMAGMVGGPAASLMVMGYTTGQMARNEALDAGMGEAASYGHAAWQGLVEAGTEYFPMKALFKDPTLSKKFMNYLWKEVASEEVATVLQSAENALVMKPDQTFGEWWDQVKHEMALTAVAAPLAGGVQYAAVKGVEKAAQISDAYTQLKVETQAGMAEDEVKAKHRAEIERQMKQLVAESGVESDEEEKDSVISYHGSPAGQVDKFDDSQVGMRNLGPEAPESSHAGRPAGHFTSESKGFASMFTQGPGSLESIKEVPDSPTNVVDALEPEQLTDLRKFYAANAPQMAPPLPEPPPENKPSPKAQGYAKMLEPIYSKWGVWQSGDLQVHVLDNHAQIPQEVQDAAKRKKMDLTNTQGLYDGANSIYVFADNIDNPAEVPQILYHESFGHFGMNQVVKSWDILAPQVLQSAPTTMKDAYDHVMGSYANESPAVQAKEILAVWSESNPTATNNFLNQIWAELRDWTRQMGFNLQVTRNDVVNLLRKSREGVERGTLTGPRAPSRPQASRSEWDPKVRRWGEAHIGESEFPVIENAGPRFHVTKIGEISHPGGIKQGIYGIADQKTGVMVPDAEAPDSKRSEDDNEKMAGKLNTTDPSGWDNRFETGKPFVVRAYHGSVKGDREFFDDELLSTVNAADSASMAHFFGGLPRTSNDYAGMVYPENTLVESLSYHDRADFTDWLVGRLSWDYQVDHGVFTVRNNTTGEVTIRPDREAAKKLAVFRTLKEFNEMPVQQQMQLINEAFPDGATFSAPTSVPVYIVAKNPLVVQMAGAEWVPNERPWVEPLTHARDNGHDVVVWKNVKDPYIDNHFGVLRGKANQIRSVNARFDIENNESPKILASRGKVNTVKINTARYLELEKPLIAQSDKVQAALQKAGIVPSSLTGQELYDRLVAQHGGRKEASKWLGDNGIPGASYREAFRPKGQKEQLVRNFITFSGSDAVVMSAEAQQIIAEEKQRQQQVLRDQVQEKMKEPPVLAWKKKIELFGKALKMPKDLVDALKDENLVWNKFIEYGTGIEEIAATNPHVPQLSAYAAAVRELWAIKGRWSTGANVLTRQWRNEVKAGKQSEQFDEFLDEAQQRSTAVGRALNPQEIKQLLDELGLDTIKGPQVQMAHRIWDDYRKAFTELGRVLETSIGFTEGLDPAEEQRLIQQVKDTVAKANNQNYFPHSNFGEWSVEFIARSDLTYKGREFKQGETVHFSTYRTKNDQKEATSKLLAEYPMSAFRPEQHKMIRARTQEFMGIPPSFYTLILSRAEEMGMDSGDLAGLENELAKIELEQSSISRLMKRTLRESKTFGYDQNSQRVYTNFMQRFANQIAKLEQNPFMMQAIADLKPVVGDNTKRDSIRNYLREHRKYVMNPGNELSWLRGFTFNLFMGFNVKSAAVNLTQTPLVTLPWLGKQFGQIAATKAIVANMDAYMEKVTKGKYRFPAPKQAMFDKLVFDGMLNESFANELAAVAEGSTFEDMTGLHQNWVRKFDSAWHWVTDKSSFLFRHAEGVNRYIAAGAAYDLALKAGRTQEQAVNEAMRAVQRTQGEYARFNRPKAAWGKQSALLVFQRFVTHMMWLIGYDPAKYRILFAWMLASGILGLPFMEHALQLIESLGSAWKKKMGYKDPKVNALDDLANFINNLRTDMGSVGEFMPTADTIMHGMSRKLPLPFTDQTTDVSGSLGLGAPIPGFSEILQGKMGESMMQGLGAVAALPIAIYDAATTESVDTFKTIESMMPASIRNLMAATRWATRGYETNTLGQPIMEFDPALDPAVIVAKGLGFPITRLNQTRELDYMQKNWVNFYEAWKKETMTRYRDAVLHDNAENKVAAKAGWDAYNAQVPYPEMKITPDMMVQSINGAARNEVLTRLGYPSKLRPYARAYKDIEEVHEKAVQ